MRRSPTAQAGGRFSMTIRGRGRAGSSDKLNERAGFGSLVGLALKVLMNSVLVTGGCGFIGSNFIRHLLGSDSTAPVINLDRLTYAGNPANLSDIAGNARYRFVKGDI